LWVTTVLHMEDSRRGGALRVGPWNSSKRASVHPLPRSSFCNWDQQNESGKRCCIALQPFPSYFKWLQSSAVNPRDIDATSVYSELGSHCSLRNHHPVLSRRQITARAVHRRLVQSRVNAVTARAAQLSRYWLIVLTTLDSGRVLLLVEYLSCARTISSYFASVVTGSFGTMCTIL
jgi:hypothetical protein